MQHSNSIKNFDIYKKLLIKFGQQNLEKTYSTFQQDSCLEIKKEAVRENKTFKRSILVDPCTERYIIWYLTAYIYEDFQIFGHCSWFFSKLSQLQSAALLSKHYEIMAHKM